MVDVPKNDELAQAIVAGARELGISPVDYATAISYETAGSFDPWKAGPTTKWGQHRGLIQWGEPQRKQYGVTKDMPVADQVAAATRYLRDAGVRPGHGLLDVYSAINAGGVGRYGASDAAAGGAPGTVADKVRGMGAHRVRAELLLNGKLPDGYAGRRAEPVVAVSTERTVPLGLAPAAVADDGDSLIEAARAIAAAAQEDPFEAQVPALRFPMLRNIRRRYGGGIA